VCVVESFVYVFGFAGDCVCVCVNGCVCVCVCVCVLESCDSVFVFACNSQQAALRW